MYQLSCKVTHKIYNIFNNISWWDSICNFAFFKQVNVINFLFAKCLKLRHYGNIIPVFSDVQVFVSINIYIYIYPILISVNSSALPVKCNSEQSTQLIVLVGYNSGP
jgi:hypothetical protein